MRRLQLFLSSAAVFLLPLVAWGQTQTSSGLASGDVSGGAFGFLLENILIFSSDVLIPFILGIGFLVFVWGMFQFFIAGGSNEESKEKGKSLMIYATLGFILIIIFYGVINLLAGSTGLQEQGLDFTPRIEL